MFSSMSASGLRGRLVPLLLGAGLIGTAACSGPAGSTPDAFGNSTPSAASTAAYNCNSGQVVYGCSYGPSNGQPMTFQTPPWMKRVTVVVRGGKGANGDRGAVGGRGGLVIATMETFGMGVEITVGAQGDSTRPGAGFASGGVGRGSSVNDDSGGGGGSTVVRHALDPLPMVVAGGGGGAGGAPAITPQAVGGRGGDAGAPAYDGFAGSGPNSDNSWNGNDDSSIVPPISAAVGGGGCANGTNIERCGPTAKGQQGGDGASATIDASGGGGGAGYNSGGSGGGSAGINVTSPGLFGGGGGGAGGQNFPRYGLNQNGVQVLANGVSSDADGSVTFLPTDTSDGQNTAFACTQGPQTYVTPAGTASLLAVLVGGSGYPTSRPDLTGNPGRGAIAYGLVQAAAGQSFVVQGGCRGGGRKTGGTGAGAGGPGGGGPCGNSDGGGGGGGGARLTSADGRTTILAAGGGGGAGGFGASAFANNLFSPGTGGAGGDAGLGWYAQGAGSGTHERAQGGGGGKSASADGSGDKGDSGIDTPCSGGGAGGGGGAQGGRGGDVTFGVGGGGGGAGSSTFQNGLVQAPGVGSNSFIGADGVDGYVVLVPQTQNPGS